jgi:hypothetical protein
MMDRPFRAALNVRLPDIMHGIDSIVAKLFLGYTTYSLLVISPASDGDTLLHQRCGAMPTIGRQSDRTERIASSAT